ncbi:phage tail protein [Planctomycetota bacterium]
MAETKDFQKSSYPLPAYNFRVTINGTPMSFSQVSGISREHETVTYRHGFSFWEGEDITAYYFKKYAPITFKKGTIKGVSFLYEWLREEKIRPMEVSLCDESGKPVVSWRIAKAIPVKLEAPTFDASTKEVSIESLEVMAAGISIEYH